MSSLHEQIGARFTDHDTRILLLALADHVEALERKVTQLEKFLPHHLQAPTVAQEDDAGRL